MNEKLQIFDFLSRHPHQFFELLRENDFQLAKEFFGKEYTQHLQTMVLVKEPIEYMKRILLAEETELISSRLGGDIHE